MIGTLFASYIRQRTKTDDISFSDTKLLNYANVEQELLALDVEGVKEGYFERVATQDLVAGQREYGFPDDILSSIKMVEITLDGTNWRRCTPFDLNEYRKRQNQVIQKYNSGDIPSSFSYATTDEVTIEDTFSDDFPQYDVAGRTIVIYTESAIPAVTAGIKISYSQYPASLVAGDLASTDDLSINTASSFRLPRQVHKIWAQRVVRAYKNDNKIPLDDEDMRTDQELQRALASLSLPNADQEFTPTVPMDDGYEY